MAREYPTTLDLVGNTPIVRLDRLSPAGHARILAKLEYLNPGIGLSMIEAAERDGLLQPGGAAMVFTKRRHFPGTPVACDGQQGKVEMTMENGRGTSRSGFLKQAAGATMVVAGAGVGVGALAQQAAAASPTTGRFYFELGGLPCGRLAGATGGYLGYEVLLDAPSGDNFQHKHLGQPKYEDFSIQVGSGMADPMYRWIKDSFDKGGALRSGAIVSANSKNEEIGRRGFSQALITSVTIPALDAASKTPGNFTVTFSSPKVSDDPPSGQPVQGAKEHGEKAWLCSNFRLILDGVDTTRVSKIEAITVKQRVVAGGSVVLDVGDFGVTFDPPSQPSWQTWYDNFAVGGDATDERNGVLELVGQDGTVLDLGLFNLGLYRMAQRRKAYVASMYCERTSWNVKPIKR